MIANPMTFIVLLVLAGLFVAGVFIVRKAMREREQLFCPGCGERVRAGSQYCSHCRHELQN